MYLKKQKRGDDIYLSIMEKYYVPGVGARERTYYEGIGLVSELKDAYNDPIAHFDQYAKELTKKVKKERTHSITLMK